MGHLRIFFISLLLLNASGALAATIHVQSTGTNNPGCSQASPCATVAYGLSQAVSGDTIQIGPGTFTGLELNITTTNLTITGSGESLTILDGQNLGRAFAIENSTVSISDLSIINGRAVNSRNAVQNAATAGGCLLLVNSDARIARVTMRRCLSTGASSAGPAGCLLSASSRLDLSDSTLASCRAGIAAAIYFMGSSVGTIARCNFLNSSTDPGGWGGAIVPEAQSVLDITDSTFMFNYGGYGGAIDDGGNARWTVKNSTFAFNSALYGGAIYTFGDTIATIEDSRFFNNSVFNSGGAVRTTTRTTPTFTRCHFEGNSAGSGGAISVFSEKVSTIQDCTFVDNYAQSFGGGLDSQYPMVLRNTTFSRNRCSSGTVYLIGAAAMSLDGLTFADNVGNLGAGIFIESPEVAHRVMRNMKFLRNTARLSGGAIQVSGLSSTDFVDVECRDNAANSGGCFYAAQQSSLQFSSGVIQNNVATSRGGAGVFSDLSRGNISRTLVELNSASSIAGGILIDASAATTLDRITLRSNKARFGGALAFSELSSTCSNATGISFLNNTASFSGGAIYFESATPACRLDFCVGCSFADNSAVYGADATSKPSNIVILEMPPQRLAPSQRFNATIELHDVYDVAVKNIRDYLVEAQLQNVTGASTNATLRGITSVDVNEAALATFLLLRIQAPPGTRAVLTFSSFPATTTIRIPIEIAECPAGTEAYTVNGEYFCLETVDTTRAVKITFIVLASAACVIAISFLIIIIVHRANSVLRKASILFCCLICVGALLMYSSVYMFIFNTDATCALRPWLLMLGFSLCYGSLFIKEWRLWRMFDPNINSRVRIRDIDLLKGLAVLLIAELGFLIIWFAVSPFVLDVSPNLSLETITYQCNSRTTGAIFWVLVAFNGLVLVMGCIIAFLIRNLPDNWNESRYLAFANYTVTLTIIVCLGICGALYQPNVISVVASIGVLFSTTATLFGLFIPKFLFVFYRDAMRKSLLQDIENLNQDIRWKQRQLHELDSKSRNSLNTGSATMATMQSSGNSVTPQGPSINQSFDARSFASVQANASGSVIQPLTGRSEFRSQMDLKSTAIEGSDDVEKGKRSKSKSSVRSKSASSRSKTSTSSVAMNKRPKKAPTPSSSSTSEEESEDDSTQSEESAMEEEEMPKKKVDQPKRKQKQPSSTTSSDDDDDSSKESS